MNNTVKDKSLSLVQEEQMLAAGDRVLVAVSGGADSMTLLHLLWGAQDELALSEVAAVHIHHGLRGAEADHDEAVVRDFCLRQGIRLFVYHADVAALAAERGRGVEETGREVRYDFLARTAAENGFSRIATAHTLSDAMETVLLHMARGSGMGGLAGIPPVRGNIIRPLLTCTRADIERYCAEYALPTVHDSTNDDIAFARNRVRACIVPQLYSLNPHVDEAFARLMRAAQIDEAYWQEQTAAALDTARVVCGVYRAPTLQSLPPALRRRVVMAAVAESADVHLEERHVRAAEELLETSGSVNVNGGVVLSVKQAYLTVGIPIFEIPEQPLTIGKRYQFGTLRFSCAVWDTETFENWKKIHKILLQSSCDYDKLKGMITLRTRRSGDCYHPYHRGGGKSVKKWMNECRVPAVLRDVFPLVVDEDGVALIPGLGCDRRVAIDATTRRVLSVFQEEKEG